MLPYYYPTSALVVDDDATFLESFRFRFDDAFPCQILANPEQAIDRLMAQDLSRKEMVGDQIALATSSSQSSVHDADDLQLSLQVNLAATAAPNNRFDQISVVIVDFDMPSMNGIQLCRRLSELPVKKILLTGQAQEAIAIDAFNEGVIDYFLRKQDERSDQELLRKVPSLAVDYFEDITRSLKAELKCDESEFLFDPEFADLFNEFLSNTDVAEYYFTTAPRGVVIVDSVGDASVFLITDRQTMQAHSEIAAYQDAPREFLDLVSSGKMMPWFPTQQGYYAAEYATNWMNYVYPVLHSNAGRGWVTSLVRGERAMALLPDRFVSFDAFRANVQPSPEQMQ